MTHTVNWAKGLIPTIIQHQENGNVLMLGYMNAEAFQLTQSTNVVHFFSRSKNRIWMKGETSGNELHVKEINIDCDDDTILIQAMPLGPVCHTGADTCFGAYKQIKHKSSFLDELEHTISSRIQNGDNKSYVNALVKSGINRVAQKVGEEAVEVVIASIGEEEKLIDEASDLLFHLMVLLQAKGRSLDDIISNLKQRHNK